MAAAQGQQTSVQHAAKRRFTSAALLAVTIPIGIAWRMAPLHLAPFAFKYGGSALWAIAVYWTVVMLLPRLEPLRVGLLATVVSLAVELLKMLYWPPLDHFRLTLVGKLLLGRYFSLGAIACYWAAISLTALGDHCFRAAAWRSRDGHPQIDRGR